LSFERPNTPVSDDGPEVSRRWLLRTAGAGTTAAGLGVVSPASAEEYDDPEYPSPEWFAREQENWARTREEPIRQANDPAFQARWHEQSLRNFTDYGRQLVEQPGWQRGRNLCQQYVMQCTGDPCLYPTSALPGPSSVETDAVAAGGDIAAELDGRADVETVLEVLDRDVDVDAADGRLARWGVFSTADAVPDTDVTPETALRGGVTDPPTASVPAPSASTLADGPHWNGHSFYDEVGEVQPVAFYDSGLDQDDGGARLSGRVWAPLDSEPGDELPGVVVTNGSIQAPETIYWWVAHALVAAGYVVLTYDPRGQGRSDNTTPGGSQGGNANPSVFVTNQVDAIDFFRATPEDPYQHTDPSRSDDDAAGVTDANPYWDRLDRDRLGVIGHSLGATGVSVVQGIEWPAIAKGERNPVDAAVAWDNLAAPGSELAGRAVEPRVPAMGQSADYFAGVPKTQAQDPAGRTAGFAGWRAVGIPTYQLNVRGGTHFEWARIPTFPATSWDSWGNELAAHFTVAWLDYWLKTDAELREDAEGGPGVGPPAGPVGPDGRSAVERRLVDLRHWCRRLSFYYRSARYLPPADRRTEWPTGESPAGWYVSEDLREDC
jgi:dienelactone hydrolase